MKRLILLLLLPLGVMAQSHQTQVISFVDSHLGKRVGSGVCIDLVDHAYRQWDKKWKEKTPVKGGKPYGLAINYEDLEPGDVILTHGEVELDGHHLPSHIMIAYKKKEDGSWIIADQNAGQSLKESRVRLSEFDEQVWIDGSKKIIIEYFRPM